MNTAETPFEFVTVSYLTRIGNQSAGTLAEFLTGLENCSDASIFHHTFQTLGSHHFLTEGFSNDFAQWVLVDANREKNIYDDRYGGHGPGAFADFVIIASFTRRF